MRRDEAILAAAEELFSQKSFAAVGVAEIGKVAGISGPAIYRHFGSKDEILATLLERSSMKLLIGLGSPREDSFDDIKAVVTGHVDFVLGDPKLASIWVREARSLTGEYERRMTRIASTYTDRVLNALRRQFARRSDLELLTAAWMMIYQVSSLDLWPPETRKCPSLRELMIESALSALMTLDPATTGAAPSP